MARNYAAEIADLDRQLVESQKRILKLDKWYCRLTAVALVATAALVVVRVVNAANEL